MLSYRHGYHAGNHADVFKHLVLSLLVRSLLTKDKPFFYLDTHAGAGRYDLGSAMARKNREYAAGIGRIWTLSDPPDLVRAYLETIRTFNPTGTLHHYPGSPRIVRPYLRQRDRMALCELHPTDNKLLNAEFAGDKRVRVHSVDGYHSLKAMLPPPERRGLVHIDPAYELKSERRNVLEAVKTGHARWPTGIYAVWFPIQDRGTAEDFLRRFRKSGLRKMLVADLRVSDEDDTMRLNGSGMIVINPPFRLDEQLQSLLPWLWEKLAEPGQGGWRVEWLVGETDGVMRAGADSRET